MGEVIDADDPKLLGKRVVGEINLACGKCSWCNRGLGRHCPHRTVLGIVKHPGAFREVLTLPERNLHLVPDTIPTEHAVFVEPIAAACEILDQIKIPEGEAVAVLGDGKLGLLVAQVLQVSRRASPPVRPPPKQVANRGKSGSHGRDRTQAPLGRVRLRRGCDRVR